MDELNNFFMFQLHYFKKKNNEFGWTISNVPSFFEVLWLYCML